MGILFVFFLALAPLAGHAAGFALDADALYFSDSFTYSGANTSTSRLMWDVAPGMGLDHKARYVLGWNYDSMSFTDNPGTTTTLTITDMGPKLTLYFDKDRSWPLAFTYNIISTGNYSGGGATAQLRGTSMKVEFGYVTELLSGVLMGLKVNYYRAAFGEQVVSTTLNKISNSRTVIYPTLSFIFRVE